MLLPALSLLIALCLQAHSDGSADAVRVEKNINRGWTFNYFPEEKKSSGVYEMPDFDDSSWSAIALPHTWQTYETTHELHPYIRNAAASDNPYWWNGWGWYRKHITIAEEHRGKRVRFEFDGVQKYSEIYLNGVLLDTHKGGFTSFYADATEAVRFGQDNVLVVAVNNTLSDRYRIPPMNAGNWVVYGGITRDVRIVLTDPVNIPFQGSCKHEGGTFIKTLKANSSKADVEMLTYVWNQDGKDREVTLRTTILSPDGKKIASASESRRIVAGELSCFTRIFEKIKKPQLWSPDSPSLYKAVSEVITDGRVADRFDTEFGIRTISWDYDAHRLVLNGKITHLHGINRHEEYVWLGQAFPKWIAQRDMEDMKHGLDINYMRTAHYPNDPSVYAFMDRNGICINEELPNIKNQDFSDAVQEQNCREMIRRDRNHPCIIIWSMGNETNKACDSRFAYEEDKTRIITVRQPYNESYNPEFCRHTDKEMPVESYLRCTIKGWYDRDDAPYEPSDGQWAGTEYWQHKVSREKGAPISEHNGTVWLYADHGADRAYLHRRKRVHRHRHGRRRSVASAAGSVVTVLRHAERIYRLRHVAFRLVLSAETRHVQRRARLARYLRIAFVIPLKRSSRAVRLYRRQAVLTCTYLQRHWRRCRGRTFHYAPVRRRGRRACVQRLRHRVAVFALVRYVRLHVYAARRAYLRV